VGAPGERVHYRIYPPPAARKWTNKIRYGSRSDDVNNDGMMVCFPCTSMITRAWLHAVDNVMDNVMGSSHRYSDEAQMVYESFR
jgi:hypothetical protein